MNKRVLICCLADPSKNPRPNRIINFLNEKGFIVDVCSYEIKGNLAINNNYYFSLLSNKIYRVLLKGISLLIKFNDIDLKLRDIINGISKIKNKIDLVKYEIIIIENVEFLDYIIKNKSNLTKVMCDLREFYPLEFENSLKFKLLESAYKRKICRKYLYRCDALITVSNGLKDAFKNWFKVDSEVIYSVPYYQNLEPKKVDNFKIKMVHHGGANFDRKLENMIYIFKFLDERFFLDFYLVGDKNYIKHLKKLAKPFSNRINFLEPLPFEKIIPSLNNYDIGLYLLEDTNFNTRFCLPNKFFEYIQARLMLAIGPSPEMKILTEKYELGIVSKSFNPYDLALILNSLTSEDIYKFKNNSHIAAKELCYENESKKLEKIIEKLLDK